MEHQAGYFAAFFRNVINTTWPNPRHVFYNGARDGIPPHDFESCLLSSLPASGAPHLLLLEFGSMARHVRLGLTERLVRRLVTLPSRPALVFVTVREWCPAAHVAHNAQVGDYAVTAYSKMAGAEQTYERFCQHYNASCLSYFSALAPPHFAGRPGFSRADIASVSGALAQCNALCTVAPD